MKFPAFLASYALTSGDDLALACGDGRVTFRELHESSDSIAAALCGLGVQIGDRVAICLPNCVDFVPIFLGIIKCGAVALPINMRLSQREIAHIMADAMPAAVFYGAAEQTGLRPILEGSAIHRILLGGEPLDDETAFSAMTGRRGTALPDIPADHDDCLISYTSGTTGRPKGVVTTQANYIVANGFLNGVHWGLSKRDRILVTTPLAHRTAFARVPNTLVLGCPLFILPRFDAAAAVDVIEREAITVLSMVPTVGRMLLPSIEAQPERFRSLRILVATGEAFPVDVKKRIMAALPQVGIFSYYAMTEAGSLAMLRPDEQLSHGGTVGRVTPGIEMRLVGPDGHDVERGDAGEIWVRSGTPGQYLIFSGYFRQEQATREAFHNGWFRTGDIGRMDADGFLQIIDRKKDMVLSGGYNIYSKEVEMALGQHAEVLEAAVIGVPDDVYGEAVAAFVETEKGATVTKAALIAWCATELAGYKKPKYLEFVPELPRNSMGKVRKDELRTLFKTLSETGKTGGTA